MPLGSLEEKGEIGTFPEELEKLPRWNLMGRSSKILIGVTNIDRYESEELLFFKFLPRKWLRVCVKSSSWWLGIPFLAPRNRRYLLKSSFSLRYFWWFRNPKQPTWDEKNLVNDGITYQPQLVDRISINGINTYIWYLGALQCFSNVTRTSFGRYSKPLPRMSSREMVRALI